MKVLSVLAVTSLSSLAAAASYSTPFFGTITDMVSFGDSYTDESRIGYFIGHNDTAPPAGWEAPPSNSTATGGKSWARIASELSGIKLHNYAVSGSVCSNELTPKYCSCLKTGIPFPSVTEYEVPAFFADQKVWQKQGKAINYKKTVFTIWIGTNDLGNGALTTNDQLYGSTLVDVTNCAVNLVKTLYKAGARNFIFQNVSPLDKMPLYATPANGGVTDDNHFFPNKLEAFHGNYTAVTQRVKELVLTANQIYKYQLNSLSEDLDGVKIAYFDSHAVFLDIIATPKKFLA
ncbi:hypothetical protein HDV00_006533, partial [Rhizophlyctis rosea]